VASSSDEDDVCTACADGSFTDVPDLTECAVWTECVPGQVVAAQGSDTSDRRCEPCGAGEYSAMFNAENCVPHSECAPGTRQTEAGTVDRPSVCVECAPGEYCAGADAAAEGCAASTWDDDQDPGTPCTDHTACSPGSFLETMGDATTDPICAECASGSFSVDANVLACQPWQVCPAGTFVQTLPMRIMYE
jgi:hypothetical protein